MSCFTRVGAAGEFDLMNESRIPALGGSFVRVLRVGEALGGLSV